VTKAKAAVTMKTVPNEGKLNSLLLICIDPNRRFLNCSMGIGLYTPHRTNAMTLSNGLTETEEFAVSDPPFTAPSSTRGKNFLDEQLVGRFDIS